MKVYLILCLLFAGTFAEKKINLDDIERDNLRAESISNSGIVRSEGTKYLTKPEHNNQQDYQIPSQYIVPTNSPATYVPPPQIQNIQQETYVQSNNYAVKEQSYQQNAVLPEENAQYYAGYRQESAPTKEIPSNVYESSQLTYQPEVTVGNQYQTVQQKAVTEKYAKNVNKDTVYVDIPMAQFLSYYPNLNIHPGKTGGLLGQPLLQQQNTAATEQISIPVYTSALSQKFILPKSAYQIQYAPKYTAAVPSAFTTKIKGIAFSGSGNPKKFIASPHLSSPIYLPPEQLYQHEKQLYTQAYVPPQPQYVPQFVYHPAAVYMHSAPIYSDVYARTPYHQDNGARGNVKEYNVPQQLYTEELPKQVLRQQVSQSVSQNYVKLPEEPNTHFVPPQLPAQDFKSGITQLVSVPQEEESYPTQNQIHNEPRSLLDTYVPSKVIAAQDSARYRERPIKLEGGFLPSKENFLYKKRKAE